MTPAKSPREQQEKDPAIEKGAVNREMERYESAQEIKSLDSETEKELGEVERSLEDTTMGIEDAT